LRWQLRNRWNSAKGIAMPRMARVVVPDIPHHVTQRGNRRQRVFFRDDDYHAYIRLLTEHCERCDVQVWAYYLMPNHVHVVMVPRHCDGLHRSLAEAHRRYTRYINFREGWRGYLWQGRFASFPMDEHHLLAAVRYVELNPVRARLCDAATDWPWSSARAHLSGQDDGLVMVSPMQSIVHNRAAYLDRSTDADEYKDIRLHTRTGRPLGSKAFVKALERATGRKLKKRKAGRPPRQPNATEPDRK
jgi:REP-associated tyrosine transposase